MGNKRAYDCCVMFCVFSIYVDVTKTSFPFLKPVNPGEANANYFQQS